MPADCKSYARFMIKLFTGTEITKYYEFDYFEHKMVG